MAKKQRGGTNRNRGFSGLSGDEIKVLNELKDGLGTKIHSLTTGLSNRIDGASGHKGTVSMKPQTRRDVRGIVQPTMDFNQGRLANLPLPEEGGDPVTLEYWRKHEKDCAWFEKMADDCLDLRQTADGSDIAPTGVIQAFWAYTIHMPEMDNSYVAHHRNYHDIPSGDDPFMRIWQFTLPETAVVNFVRYYREDIVFDGPGATSIMALGLYDYNRDLYWQQQHDMNYSGALEGVNEMVLDEELTIDAGTYFLAWYNPACSELYSTDIPYFEATDVVNANFERFTGSSDQIGEGNIATDYLISSATDPVFPATIPTSPFLTAEDNPTPGEVVSSEVPLFFFSYR
jgi:hypothetical protein